MSNDDNDVNKSDENNKTEEFVENATNEGVIGEEFNEDEQAKKDYSDSKKQNVASDDLKAVFDVPIQVSAVLGRSVMPVNQLLKLGRGAVVELDKKVGESIDIFVNNKLIARGEVVVVGERLGITMTEIIKSNMTY